MDAETQAALRSLRQEVANLQAQIIQAGDNSLLHGIRHVDGTDYIWGEQTANYIFASPSGSAGGPGFRAMVAADLPAYTATIVCTAAGAAPTTTSGCADQAKVEAGTNDVDYWVMDFDTATDEFCFWGPIPLPDGATANGTFTAVPYWTAASGSGTVCFAISMACRANDDAIDQAWGTSQSSTDTLITAGDVHVGPTTSAITPAGTIAGGNLLFIRCMRDVSEDTLGVDARLIALKIEYSRSYSD